MAKKRAKQFEFPEELDTDLKNLESIIKPLQGDGPENSPLYSSIEEKHNEEFQQLQNQISGLSKFKIINLGNHLEKILKRLESCELLENSFSEIKSVTQSLQQDLLSYSKDKNQRQIVLEVLERLKSMIGDFREVFSSKIEEIEVYAELKDEEMSRLRDAAYLEKLEKQWKVSYIDILNDSETCPVWANKLLAYFMPLNEDHGDLQNMTSEGVMAENFFEIPEGDYKEVLLHIINKMSLEVIIHIANLPIESENIKLFFAFIRAINRIQNSEKTEKNIFGCIFSEWKKSACVALQFSLHSYTFKLTHMELERALKQQQGGFSNQRLTAYHREVKLSAHILKNHYDRKIRELCELYADEKEFQEFMNLFGSHVKFSKAVMDDMHFFKKFIKTIPEQSYKSMQSFPQVEEVWRESYEKVIQKAYEVYSKEIGINKKDFDLEKIVQVYGKDMFDFFERKKGCLSKKIDGLDESSVEYALKNQERFEMLKYMDMLKTLFTDCSFRSIDEEVFGCKEGKTSLKEFFYKMKLAISEPGIKYEKIAELTQEVWLPSFSFQREFNGTKCIFDVKQITDPTEQNYFPDDEVLFHLDIGFFVSDKKHHSISLAITKRRGCISRSINIGSYLKFSFYNCFFIFFSHIF